MTASSQFWDGRAESYDDGIRKHDGIYEQTISYTKSFLNSSDSVLDFGCASGEMSLDIAPHVQDAHGIDTSGKMIDLAGQKASDRQIRNTKFSQFDVFEPSLKAQSFSAILAFNIFHLVNDAEATLARLHDLLTPNGLLISQTPCLAGRAWLFKTLIGFAQRVGYAPKIRSFTPTELEGLVSAHRFEIVDSQMWDEANQVQWIVGRKR